MRNGVSVDLTDGRNSVQSYFEDISALRSDPLSRQREGELAVRIQEGDVQARNELVQANLRFVIDVAKHYQHRGLPLADLISAGNLGLLLAAERFDPTRGFKFISYAVWWVRQSIQQMLTEQTRLVRLPANKVDLLRRISKASDQLRQEREGDPDAEAIATVLDLPVAEVKGTLRSACVIRSLDERSNEEDDRSLLDILTDEKQALPDIEAEWASDQALWGKVLSRLDAREQYILRLYFGLEGMEERNLNQIGQLMGVTRERVRQIKERALEKLCHPSCRQELEELIDGV
jgi:RNA polymerase primary sigma factor